MRITMTMSDAKFDELFHLRIEQGVQSEVPHPTDGIAYPLMPSTEINSLPAHDAPYSLVNEKGVNHAD